MGDAAAAAAAAPVAPVGLDGLRDYEAEALTMVQAQNVVRAYKGHFTRNVKFIADMQNTLNNRDPSPQIVAQLRERAVRLTNIAENIVRAYDYSRTLAEATAAQKTEATNNADAQNTELVTQLVLVDTLCKGVQAAAQVGAAAWTPLHSVSTRTSCVTSSVFWASALLVASVFCAAVASANVFE